MTSEKLLVKLERWIKVVERYLAFLIVIEIVVVIVIGIASNKLEDEHTGNLWRGILIILAVLYAFVKLLQFWYEKTFPSSIVEELVSKQKLEQSLDIISRKDAIYDYLSATIIGVGHPKSEVKPLKEGDDFIKQSDNDFTRELKAVTRTFTSALNVILNTKNSKFLVGMYTKYNRAVDHKNHPHDNNGIFIARNDFSDEINMKDLMTTDNKGLELEIENVIKTSLNDGKYVEKLVNVENLDGRTQTFLAINLPNAVNRQTQVGVFFIMTEKINELPTDLQAVLTTFSNAFSIWLQLYVNSVVNNQMDVMFSEIDESEVDSEESQDEAQKK